MCIKFYSQLRATNKQQKLTYEQTRQMKTKGHPRKRISVGQEGVDRSRQNRF